MKIRYHKRARLQKRSEYLRVIKSKNRCVGNLICINWHLADAKNPKLGITAPSHFGNSVQRNRFKRIVREAFRVLSPLLPSNLEINIYPQPGALEATSLEIQKEILKLLEKAKILSS